MEYSWQWFVVPMKNSEDKHIPWWSIETGESEIDNLVSVVKSEYLNEGSVTEEFEHRLAEFLEGSKVVTSTSGTAALFIALKALGVGAGDKVLVPNMTFIATATAVEMAGAKVVLVDVDEDTMTISQEDLIRKIDDKVKAVIPVHVSGRSAWNSVLHELNQRDRIIVIEDAAEALGSRDPLTGKLLGTMGSAGIFSFSPNKLITTGQGGALTSRSSDILQRARALKDQGRVSRGTGGADRHDLIGYNFKLTNLQSAVGLAQLERAKSRVEHLKKVFSYYQNNIDQCDHVRLMPFNVSKGEFPLWPELNTIHKESIKLELNSKNIGFRDVWHPLNTQKPFLNSDSFPVSAKLSKETLWLPSAFKLTEDDLNRISSCIRCATCH